MLESSVLLLAQSPQVPAWVPISALVVAILSALFTGLNLLLTYLRDRREKQRDRKEVDLVSSIEDRALFALEEAVVSAAFYRCTVTNVGVPGVQIRGVGLRSHGNAGAEIPLQLAQGQADGPLERGASQVWEIALEGLQKSLSGSGPVEVVSVATDTVGDQHAQDPSKSLPIPLGD